MMRNLTPEQRRAMREAHWQEMRERAVKQGVEFPELPPWKQAEQRRAERWEQYREIVDEMSEEQREAAEMIFGQGSRPVPPGQMQEQMLRGMPMQQPYGGTFGMPMRPMMPGYGGQGAGPSMQEWGPSEPWSGPEGAYPTPPAPQGGYGQPW
jgi:hypothetical protein